jgi:hypothetical protein
MRLALMGFLGLACFAAVPARATTIVVYTHPETFERRLVVLQANGPDRLFLCMLPPGEAGCQQVPLRRVR